MIRALFGRGKYVRALVGQCRGGSDSVWQRQVLRLANKEVIWPLFCQDVDSKWLFDQGGGGRVSF